MINNVKINGVVYEVQDGVSFKDTATEELDSGTIQILNTPDIPLEPMQEVVVTFANGTKKYMVVNTWVEENATFDTNLKNYIISLISETKKLERCIMPNTAITQPLGIEPKRNYLRYLNRAMALYVNPIYPEIRTTSELMGLLTNTTAIEEQFTTPNVKEYLNAILSKLNRLIHLEDDRLKLIDLSSKKKPIDESKLFFKNTEQSIEDYYSDIYTDVQNVQSEKETIYTELVGVRAPNEAILTTDNGIVQLSHNINYLKRVVVYCYIKDASKKEEEYKGFGIYGNDYKFIKEKAEYDLLKVSNQVSVFDGDYKRMNLYFTRGSNTIEGLSYRESTWIAGMDSVFPAIENIIVAIGKDHKKTLELKTDIRQLMFEVTYSAIDDVSVKFEKEKSIKSYIRDNQTDSIVDLDKFAQVQQEKINRLGNDAMTITARYDSLDEVPELLDYIGDYVLAEREIIYHNDYIDFKGVLYKNFIKKNVFYGVNAKRRTTQLLMPNEAVVRKELTKEKYTFGFDDKSTDKHFQRYVLGKICASEYTDETFDMTTGYNKYDFTPLQIVTCKSTFEDGTSKNYKLEPDVRKAFNSVTINFKFLDNVNVGLRITDLQVEGGYGQQYVSYTDANGEVAKLTLTLYGKTHILDNNYDVNMVNKFPEYSSTLPNDRHEVYSKELIRYKDNREVLNETLQFEFGAEDNIFINSRLIDELSFFRSYAKEKFYIWISTGTKYDKYNKDVVVEDAVKQEKGTLEISYEDYLNFINNNVYFNKIMLYNNNVDLSNVVSWAIADFNGKVYIAVNKRDTDATIPTTIYLNKEE